MAGKKPKPRALRPSQVAAELGVHRLTVIRWVEAGELHAWRTPGNHYRIWLSDLESFIDKRTVQ